MAKFALIRNGVVENVVVISNDNVPPAGYVDTNGQEAAIGWAVVDGVIVAPPADPPADPVDALADLEARIAVIVADIAALKS